MTALVRARSGDVARRRCRASRGRLSPPPLASEVVQGSPAPVLTRAAADADLLVLGSHGHGRLRHAILGSVSDECIRHAPCPVVVVPVPAPVPAGPSTEAAVER